MPELLARWSELVMADVPLGEALSAPARSARSVLRPPAPEEEVALAEDRLGVRLPPSYREFLLLSDGAYASLHGPMLEGQSHSRAASIDDAGFLPVRDIAWLRDVSPGAASMWGMRLSDDPERPADTDGDEIWPWTPMARGLQIAVDFAPGTTCLVPFDDLEEWQVWNITKETSETYRSFRSMLEFQVEIREPIITVDELDQVLSRAAAHEIGAVLRISRTTTEDAIPVLSAVVASAGPRDRSVSAHAVRGLARIGTDEAADALVRLDHRDTDEALAEVGTDHARELLVARGGYHWLALLRDPRAIPIAAAALELGDERGGMRNEAIKTVGRSGDPSYESVVRPYVTSDDVWDRVAAAEALALLGLADGRNHLLALTDHPRVGHVARQALARLDEATPL